MKKYMPIIKTGFVLALMLLTTVIVVVLLTYAGVLKNEYANGEDITSALADFQGSAAITLVFMVIMIASTAFILVDIYVRESDRNYSIQLQQLVSAVDQQTTPDKIEFYADRLIKFVAKTAVRQKASLKNVYTGLHDLYLIKAMKSEEEMSKFKNYIAVLIKAYAESNGLTSQYNNSKIQKITEAAALYDIGKLAIPGYILYKETVLTKDEYDIVKKHVKYGYDLIQAINPECALGSFEQYARDIVGYHHERYDGKGYPYGLIGDNIPFLARIATLVMTYEAVTKERPFKKPLTHDEAVLLINNEKNRQLDPKVVKAFDSVEQEFKRIKERVRATNSGSRRRQIVDADLVEDNKITDEVKLAQSIPLKKEDLILPKEEPVKEEAIPVEEEPKKATNVDEEAIYKQYGIEVPVREEKRIQINKKQAKDDDDDFIEMDVKEDKE